MLRGVIHDWDDARATAILAACRSAMASRGTILIVERVLPERSEYGRAANSYLLDLEMLVNTPGGRERRESEFRSILSDAGFAMTRRIPTATSTSIIEGRPA